MICISTVFSAATIWRPAWVGRMRCMFKVSYGRHTECTPTALKCSTGYEVSAIAAQFDTELYLVFTRLHNYPMFNRTAVICMRRKVPLGAEGTFVDDLSI